MFCPQCGTKTTRAQQQFCRECGASIDGAAGSQQRGGGTAAATPPLQRQRPYSATHAVREGNALRTLLMVAGAVLLVPLALVVVFGLLATSLVIGAALIATAIKLAPVVAIGLIIYWALTRQRRARHSWR